MRYGSIAAWSAIFGFAIFSVNNGLSPKGDKVQWRNESGANFSNLTRVRRGMLRPIDISWSTSVGFLVQRSGHSSVGGDK